MNEELVKTKIGTAMGLLQSALDEMNDVAEIISTPMGTYQRDAATGKLVKVKQDEYGKWIPVPVDEPEPEPETQEVVWPVTDFNDFVFLGTESYAQYIRKHMKTCCDVKVGAAGLVSECKTYWDKRATFYEPIKQFIAMWPQYFPKETA